MALPALKLLDEDLTAFASEAAPSYDSWRNALEKHARQLDRLSEMLDRMERTGAEVIADARREIEQGLLSLDLDAAIGHYEDAEREFQELLGPQIREARQRVGDRSSLPGTPQDRARAESIWQRQLEINVRALEWIRDLRWQLMALRAMAEAAGDGPVFDDPVELERYLDEL